MPEQKELCCLVEFTCCVFHIFGYIQNLLFLSLFCPAASSFFLWCGLCGYLESYNVQKSANTENPSIRQPCCCCVNVWWLRSHHISFFSNDTGCFTPRPPICLWLVYPEAKPFLLLRPRQRQTGSYHSSLPLEREIAEVCSSNPIRHWPARGRTGHMTSSA